MLVGLSVLGLVLTSTMRESEQKVSEPIRISHSQLGVWQDCQQKWHYSYVEKLIPIKQSPYLQRGQLVHELLAVYDQVLQQGLRPGSREALDHVLAFADSDLHPGMNDTELENYVRALAACSRFIREFSPHADEGIKILAVEEYFEMELETPKGNRFIIEGYVDRIFSQYGNMWVIDRKSTSTGKHYTQEMILMDNQLSTYTAVLRAMGYPIFGVGIDSINTYPYKDYAKEPVDKLFKRIIAPRADRELQFSLYTYGRAVDQMIEHLRSGDDPIRRLTRDCTRCQYCDLCLYEMKGISTEMLRTAKFKEKPGRGQGTKVGFRIAPWDQTHNSGE